jgi:pyridoxal biosynthesis lyase PdxS
MVLAQMRVGPVVVTITTPEKNYYAEQALGAAGIAVSRYPLKFLINRFGQFSGS